MTWVTRKLNFNELGQNTGEDWLLEINCYQDDIKERKLQMQSCWNHTLSELKETLDFINPSILQIELCTVVEKFRNCWETKG